jgi:hypothetical protein
MSENKPPIVSLQLQFLLPLSTLIIMEQLISSELSDFSSTEQHFTALFFSLVTTFTELELSLTTLLSSLKEEHLQLSPLQSHLSVVPA